MRLLGRFEHKEEAKEPKQETPFKCVHKKLTQFLSFLYTGKIWGSAFFSLIKRLNGEKTDFATKHLKL